MADRSEIYSGVIEYYDPDVVIDRIPNTFPWQPKRNVYLPDKLRELIRKNNAQSKATAQAVAVPYQMGTARITWLKERLMAVDERVKFIKARTDAMLLNLKDAGDPTYDILSTGIKIAVASVPVVGQIVSGVIAADQNAQKQAANIDAARTQMLLRDYTEDLQELARIRINLANEFTGGEVVADVSKGLTNNAPTAVPTWYYVAGVLAVLLVVIIIARRTA